MAYAQGLRACTFGFVAHAFGLRRTPKFLTSKTERPQKKGLGLRIPQRATSDTWLSVKANICPAAHANIEALIRTHLMPAYPLVHWGVSIFESSQPKSSSHMPQPRLRAIGEFLKKGLALGTLGIYRG